MTSTMRAPKSKPDASPTGAGERMSRPKKSRVTRLAGWSARHPWLAILLWVVFVTATFVGGGAAGTRAATDADLEVGQAGTAARLAQQGALQSPAIENVLVTSRAGALQSEAATTAVTQLKQSLQSLDGVSTIVGPLPSADRQALLLRVSLRGDPDTASERVRPLQDATAAAQQRFPGLVIEEVGDGSIRHQFDEWLGQDVRKATSLSVPVTLLILLFAFGAIITAGVPVLIALSAVCSALGIWALASHLIPDPGMVVHLLVLMGMAVGVDYSLFYLRRFREERAAGRGPVDAVEVAAATSGHSILVSGVAVMLSMSALYLANDVMFKAMATGAILVVAVALISSVTILPALLVKLGKGVDRPRMPLVWRLSNRSSGPRFIPALLRPVLRHPLLSSAASVVILVALSLPTLGVALKATQIADFPRSLSTMRTYDRLVAAFPDTANADRIAVEVPAGKAEELQTQLAALRGAAASDPLFGEAGEPQFSGDGTRAVLEIAVPYKLSSPEARTSVTQLRDELVPATVGSIAGATAAVGGDTASDMDYTRNLARSLPLVVGAVLLLTFLVMFWAFRSVAVSMVTVLLNLLSSAAAFGILCLVFQNTWAEGILGFTSTGHVVSWVPMLLFVVLSGLSLDYHVFVVSRIKENALSGMTTSNAVSRGITQTAGVVSSAALVMIAVFSIFGTLSFIELKQIGVGLAAAILLDATLIRIVALPSMMTVVSAYLWWPGAHNPTRYDGDDESAVRQPDVSELFENEHDELVSKQTEGTR